MHRVSSADGDAGVESGELMIKSPRAGRTGEIS
jgi:hypothetical protein